MAVEKNILLSRLEQDPDNLLRFLVLFGVVAMLLILTCTGYGLYRQSTSDVLRAAEDDAVRIGAVMVNKSRRYLFGNGNEYVDLNPDGAERFDEYIRSFLHPFGIVKIKIFNPDRRIIFSTDSEIIGQKVLDNPRLEMALLGQLTSHQETREKVNDLADEQLLDVDVVEIYLPIYTLAGVVAGSIELYLDVTRYRAEIKNRVIVSTLILATILIFVLGVSYFVLNIGAKQLRTLLQRLQHLATTDPLTGVYNRGAVLARAEEEFSRMRRRNTAKKGSSLGIIMIDLDHFKKINDSYGHQVGDVVLCEMSKRVNSCLREYDIFGRYGGEEFLVIVPDGDLKGTMATAHRIRHELIKSPTIIGSHRLEITASFGVSCCDDAKEAFMVCLQRADDALYRAKADGRNRVAGSSVIHGDTTHEVVESLM